MGTVESSLGNIKEVISLIYFGIFVSLWIILALCIFWMVVSGCSGCLGDAGEVSIAIDIIMALVVFICWITSVSNEEDYV